MDVNNTIHASKCGGGGRTVVIEGKAEEKKIAECVHESETHHQCCYKNN